MPVKPTYCEVLRLLQEALREEAAPWSSAPPEETVEEVAQFLKDAGLACGHFHGGMLPTDKRTVQEDFLAGSLQ